MASSNSAQTADDSTPITLATPPDAVGCRLQLRADTGDVTITALALILADGVRVEPFPDFQRAAFAFSYDWESAMGGLIHTRSAANSEGDGTLVSLRSDGGPVVAEAEAKGLRMRDGARFLAAQFAQHDIHATFYTTGYNLLTGNSDGVRFLDNPIYPDADAAHGWGSDYWRTHPWYSDDPFGTEETHPAWYFASLAHDLVAAGHEIASHSFGHLYVRGVKPEQLAADLQLWQRTAAAQGIATAPSFAFPWTSSNSLDERFWTIFAQLGWTVLTRLYPRDLRHPYELDRIASDPRLSVFPDFYLPSHAAVLDEALARVEETLARRGYHSLWTHPNEVLEQDGEALWTQAIAAVAAARARGLWVAPVTQIARYALSTDAPCR
ncbi:MAG: polysaccharide deacetylase family protein [Thermomicrobia bacterium]|nr:polysaccharide deacetylase family protein [Thermomicrobia bacterium]